METLCSSCHAQRASHGRYTASLDRIRFDDEKVLKKGLEQNYGICDVRFDYFNGKLSIDYNPKHTEPSEIERALTLPGYILEYNTSHWLESAVEKRGTKLGLVISGTLVALSWAMFIALGESYRFPSPAFIFINILAIAAAGYPTLREIAEVLRDRKLNVHVLIAIAVIGAIALFDWLTAATVLFITVVGESIETAALKRSRKKIVVTSIVNTKHALAKDGERLVEIPIHKIFRGQRLVVHQGMGMPVDGVVVSGSGQVNEATLTGESKYRGLASGDKVFAGMVLESGSLEIEAVSIGGQTVIENIAQMVEEAKRQKTEGTKGVDLFTRYFIPVILLLGIGVFLGSFLLFDIGIIEALKRCITILVVACPCALVLATPTAVAAAAGRSAELGVLFKNRSAVELMGRTTTLLIDKTGTLTYARPQVAGIKAFDETSVESVLADAVLVEQNSLHPIARSICEYARQHDVSPGKSGRFMEFEGGGACAKSGNRLIKVGTKWLMEDGRDFPQNVIAWIKEAEQNGYSPVLVADLEKITGGFLIADEVREDAQKMLAHLRREGIRRIVMVTGDSKPVARRVAGALGLSDYFAECMPDTKLKILEESKGSGAIVAMAGDGINDAPALAAADIGIAMGAMGSDSAMAAADVCVMTKDLRGLSDAFSLSRQTLSVIRWNIFLVVTVNILLMVLAASGLINMLMGAAFHQAIVLLIIFNSCSLFLRRVKSF